MPAKMTFAALATTVLVSTAAFAQELAPEPPEAPIHPPITALPAAATAETVDVSATATADPTFNGWPYLFWEGVQAAPTIDGGAVTAQAAEASATAPAVELVTNGPVPDTPATRALYPPLSRAGRATAPAGN